MWIIPRNMKSICFPFVQDTGGLNLEWKWQEPELANAFMWRGTHMPPPFWSKILKRVPWLRALSTRMLKPSHSKNLADVLRGWLVATPVRDSAWPVKDKVKGMKKGGTSGQSFKGQLDLFNRDSAFLKTSKDTLPSGLKTCCTTWTNWVSELHAEYIQRKNVAHHKRGKGFSSWPTPAAHEARLGFQNRANGKKGTQKSLTTVVVENGPHRPDSTNMIGRNQDCAPGQLWSTPRTNKLGAENLETWAKRNKAGKVSQQPLPTQVNKWATPTTHGNHNRKGASEYSGDGISTQVKKETKVVGRLNPNWVSQLMGLPVAWTQMPTELKGCEC